MSILAFLFNLINEKTIVTLFTVLMFSSLQAQENKMNLLIGTYTNNCESKGIYVYDFDTNNAEFSFKMFLLPLLIRVI